MGVTIHRGDEYQITIDGKWDDSPITVGELAALVLANEFELDQTDRVAVQRVQPPVEEFGNGDLIRHRESPDTVILLTDDGGYTYVGRVNRGLHVSGSGWGGHRATANSKYWERVSIE